MDINKIAEELLDQGIITAEIRTIGKDESGRHMLTTWVIDMYENSYEKPYRYSVSSKPLRFDYMEE